MRYESGASRRVSITADLAATMIAIRSPKYGFALPFTIFWLGAWTIGGSFAGATLWNKGGIAGSADLFLLFWLGAWALGWVSVAGCILWSIAGREVLRLESQVVTKRIAAGPLARSWRYDPLLIKEVRKVQPRAGNRESAMMGLPFGEYGSVAFDYGARTIHFGSTLESAEADLVINTICKSLGPRARAAA